MTLSFLSFFLRSYTLFFVLIHFASIDMVGSIEKAFTTFNWLTSFFIWCFRITICFTADSIKTVNFWINKCTLFKNLNLYLWCYEEDNTRLAFINIVSSNNKINKLEFTTRPTTRPTKPSTMQSTTRSTTRSTKRSTTRSTKRSTTWSTTRPTTRSTTRSTPRSTMRLNKSCDYDAIFSFLPYLFHLIMNTVENALCYHG